MSVEQERIDYHRSQIDLAEAELLKVVRELCPGNHNPRQYRDARQPWCPHCGRTFRGQKVKEVTR